MANTDYTRRTATGPLCPTAATAGAITQLATTVTIGTLSTSYTDPIRIGSAAMIDDEIISILGIAGSVYTIGRGCCDTVPATHALGAIIWFFDDYLTNDGIEYAAVETIAVKPLPKTAGGVQVSIAESPPIDITFNARFARPYPPSDVKVNGVTWFTPVVMDAATNQMVLTWGHRDRISQQDVLLSHTAASLSSPETGATYSMQVFNAAGVSKALVSGITGATVTYTIAQARTDFAVTTGVIAGYIILKSVRGTYNSWQTYRIDFTFDAAAATQPVYGSYTFTNAITDQAALPQITTLTITGEFRTGQVLPVVITLGSVQSTFNYTTVAGDTDLAGATTGLKNLIDAHASYSATSTGGVITITGPVSQPYTVFANNVLGTPFMTITRTQKASAYVSNSVDQVYETGFDSAYGYSNSHTYQIRIQQTPLFGGAIIADGIVGPNANVYTSAAVTSAMITTLNGISALSSLGIVATAPLPASGAQATTTRITIPAAIGDNYDLFRSTTNPGILNNTLQPVTLAVLAGPARPQISTATQDPPIDGHSYVLHMGGTDKVQHVAGPASTSATVATALAVLVDALPNYISTAAGAVTTITHVQDNVPFILSYAIVASSFVLEVTAITQQAR